MSLTKVRLVEVFPTSQERWVLADLSQFRGPAGPAGTPGVDGAKGRDGLSADLAPVTWDRVLGRIHHPSGTPQHLSRDEVFWWLWNPLGALADIDGVPLAAPDGRPFYRPDDPFDNPPSGTTEVASVEEMIALPEPWLLDRVMVLFPDPSEWLMVGGDHGLTPDGERIVAHESGYGVFVRTPHFATNGRFFEHNQVSAALNWVINHNGGRYAAGVFVMGDDGAELRARVAQPDANQVVVFHERVQSGKAILTI